MSRPEVQFLYQIRNCGVKSLWTTFPERQAEVFAKDGVMFCSFPPEPARFKP